MKRTSPVPLEFLVVLAAAGAGCITINLYFPAAELEEAAREIVTDVRSAELQGEESPPGGVEAEDAALPGESPAGPHGPLAVPEAPEEEAMRAPARPRPLPGGILAIFEPRAAHAALPDEKKDTGEGGAGGGKAGIKIDVSTPVIKRIREALKKRYPKLVPFLEKGALGEGLDGYVALRGSEGLNLKEKRDIQTLLEEENTDRKNLYAEIARESGIEASRIPDIGLLFSREWQKASKVGWWIEKEKGKWIQKPEEKKKKKP